MIKRMKGYFVDQPASYLSEFKLLKKKKLNKIKERKIYTFGNKNKNKIFYIINRSPGAGFFSNLNARVYCTGLNLLNFSKFDLWDPEMAGNGLGYPPQRVFNLGVQLKF